MTPTSLRHLARHYLEMLAAMAVGMVLYGAVVAGLSAALGRPISLGVEADVLAMATAMALAMALWMRHRRHGRREVLEMSAAMIVPFVALFVPWWTGVLTPGGLVLGGHLLMLPAMGAVLLRHRDRYAHPAR